MIECQDVVTPIKLMDLGNYQKWPNLLVCQRDRQQYHLWKQITKIIKPEHDPITSSNYQFIKIKGTEDIKPTMVIQLAESRA